MRAPRIDTRDRAGPRSYAFAQHAIPVGYRWPADCDPRGGSC